MLHLRTYVIFLLLTVSLPAVATVTTAAGLDNKVEAFVRPGLPTYYVEYGEGSNIEFPDAGTHSISVLRSTLTANYSLSQPGITFDYEGSTSGIATGYDGGIRTRLGIRFSVDVATDYLFHGGVRGTTLVGDLSAIFQSDLKDITTGGDVLFEVASPGWLGPSPFDLNLDDFLVTGSLSGVLLVGHVYEFAFHSRAEAFYTSDGASFDGNMSLQFASATVPAPGSLLLLFIGIGLLRFHTLLSLKRLTGVS